MDAQDKLGSHYSEASMFVAQEQHGAPEELPPGTIIGGTYKVISSLGSGGMSQVYRCHDMPLDRFVALKLLRTNLNQQALVRFQREGKAVALLHHPGIVQVYSLHTSENGYPFLVMEIVSGFSLAHILATRGPLPLFSVLKIVSQSCDALQHAHDNGVVHRDLKPGNMMLANAGQADEHVKILDFGIAKILVEDAVNATRTGEIFGSPAYMSPEQASGKKIDSRSDQYSLGCVIFELLTGRPPFVKDTAVSVLVSHVNDQPPTLRQIRKQEFPAHIENAVAKMLAKKPEDRFHTIIDARDAFLGNKSAQNTEARLSKKRAALLSGVAVVLFGCGYGLWTAIEKRPHDSPQTPVAATSTQEQKSERATDAQLLDEGDSVRGVIDLLKKGGFPRDWHLPTNLGDNDMQVFARYPSSSKISGIHFPRSVTDKGLSCLKFMPNLELLDVQDTDITDRSIEAISHLRSLQILDLAKDGEIHDDGVAKLAGLPALNDLLLMRTSIDGSALHSLSSLPNLQKLHLDETHVRKNIKAIAELHHLTELCLERTELDDADLDTIKQIKPLQKLDLEHNQGITDAGLMKLTSLPNLKHLDIRDCQITASGAQKFLKAISRRAPIEFSWKQDN